MPRLRSIGWSFLALSFLIIVGIIAVYIGLTIWDILLSNPKIILEVWIWPLTTNIFGGLGSLFVTFAWWSFLGGLIFLFVHYLIKLFYHKHRVPIVPSSMPSIREIKKRVGIIPAYNEESSIAEVVTKCIKYLDYVIVVNDGSKDKTAEHAKNAGAYVFNHESNKGLGVTIKDGFKEALRLDADIILTIDGDGQYDADEIPNLLEIVEKNESDIVLGSRFLGTIEKMGPIKRLGNKVFTWCVNRFSGLHLTDSQTGFRAIRREVLEEVPITSDYTYTQELLIRGAKEGFRVTEVPVKFLKRPFGKSKLISDPADYSLRVSVIGLKTYRDYHPLSLFGALGTVLIAGGILVGAIVTYNSVMYGQLLTGNLVLTALLIIMGIQILLFGLLADMYVTRYIKELEYKRSKNSIA
ncbi:MAG: glycosyltransferase [Candidatus Hodarchaeota archaeon]